MRNRRKSWGNIYGNVKKSLRNLWDVVEKPLGNCWERIGTPKHWETWRCDENPQQNKKYLGDPNAATNPRDHNWPCSVKPGHLWGSVCKTVQLTASPSIFRSSMMLQEPKSESGDRFKQLGGRMCQLLPIPVAVVWKGFSRWRMVIGKDRAKGKAGGKKDAQNVSLIGIFGKIKGSSWKKLKLVIEISPSFSPLW